MPLVRGRAVRLGCRVTEDVRADAAKAAESLRLVLASIDAEELSCSPATRHRIEGAALALESLAVS